MDLCGFPERNRNRMADFASCLARLQRHAIVNDGSAEIKAETVFGFVCRNAELRGQDPKISTGIG
jgi:hypothetical protein